MGFCFNDLKLGALNFDIRGLSVDEDDVDDNHIEVLGYKKSKKSKKSKDDSDSDSSDWDASPDDLYRRAKSYSINQPIYYWWYDPFVYRLDSIYIPTFYSYVTPYIELSLSLN